MKPLRERLAKRGIDLNERAQAEPRKAGPVALVQMSLGQFIECVQSLIFIGA
jgi:hypothetical protein